MKPLDHPSERPIDELIEVFVDGTATPSDALRVREAIEADPLVADRVLLADSIRSALQDMDAPPCPPAVVAGVIAEARRDTVRDWFRQLVQPFRAPSGAMKPVLATATLIVAVVVSARVWTPHPAASPEATAALEQVKWTLALLSDVNERTARVVRDDVMESHVIRPMADALLHVYATDATSGSSQSN